MQLRLGALNSSTDLKMADVWARQVGGRRLAGGSGAQQVKKTNSVAGLAGRRFSAVVR